MICSVSVMALSGVSWGQEAESGEERCENCKVVVHVRHLDIITVVGLRAVERSEVVGSLTTLDEDDLAVRNPINPADQLRAVPGVAVSRSGSVGGLTQVRLRGAEANHTLVLLDGIEVSDPVTGETDFGLLNGLNLRRIEVLRGEQSALYGSDAIGGVVAFQTGEIVGLTGLAEVGSNDTLRGQIGGGQRLSTGSISGALSGFTTGGVDTSGLGGEEDGSQSFSGLLSGSLELARDWELSGLTTFRASEVHTDPDLNFDGALDNADRVTESDQFLLGASLFGETGPVDHIFRASFNTVERENSADGTLTDTTTGERTKLAWSPSYESSLGNFDLRITGQVDYENEDYTRTGAASFFGDPNQSQSFETMGYAAEIRAYDWNRFSATASVRRDDNDGRFDDATTWRVGGAYHVSANGKLRASVGTGVKNPTFVELFGFFPGSFIGNPDIVPEKSQSWEIGWDHDFGVVNTSITYFSAELEDEIFTAFTPTFQSTAQNQTGTSERSGVELGARWEATDTLNINGAATFITSENDSGEGEIRVPGTTASLSFDWQPEYKAGVRLGAAFDYVGEQDDLNFGTFPAARVMLDSYVLFSLTGEYPLTERISLTVRGANLFDEEAMDVLGFHSPGAAGFVGLKLREW